MKPAGGDRGGEARIHELFDALPQPMGVHCGGQLVYANRALAELLGYETPDALLGATADRVISEQDLERSEKRTEAMLGSGSPAPPAELRFLRKDGSLVTVDIASAPVMWGGELAILIALHDLSGARALQARILQTDRMAAIGTLSAGVAHEVNNPLAYVLSNLSHALDGLRQLEASVRALEARPGPPLDEPPSARLVALAESLNEALEGAQRVRAIVRDVRTFSRGGDEPGAPVDVKRVLDSAVGMARNEIRHRARLVRDYAAVPMVTANESRLGQVFLNLLLNSAQALREGDAASHEIRVSTSTDADGSAVVEIADTGCGIAAEHLGRVFDPFFTTKPMGVGTGLGLAICHSIVTALGGSIELDSTTGRGTTARVKLPPSTNAPTPVPPSASTATVRRSSVLIVDDEPAVARALRRELQRHHDVTIARGGAEALELLRAGQPFDVVVCDVMMPDLGGAELWEQIKRERPGFEARFVFMTGGAFTQRAREFLASVPNRCVDKPVDMRELLDAIAGALDTQRALTPP